MLQKFFLGLVLFKTVYAASDISEGEKPDFSPRDLLTLTRESNENFSTHIEYLSERPHFPCYDFATHSQIIYYRSIEDLVNLKSKIDEEACYVENATFIRHDKKYTHLDDLKIGSCFSSSKKSTDLKDMMSELITALSSVSQEQIESATENGRKLLEDAARQRTPEKKENFHFDEQGIYSSGIVRINCTDILTSDRDFSFYFAKNTTAMEKLLRDVPCNGKRLTVIDTKFEGFYTSGNLRTQPCFEILSNVEIIQFQSIDISSAGDFFMFAYGDIFSSGTSYLAEGSISMKSQGGGFCRGFCHKNL